MITQRLHLSNQDARKVSATQQHRLGSIVETADGRIYRYALAGATNLLAGNLQINPALVANHVNRAVAADVTVSVPGSNNVTVSLGGTAATLNQYKDGYLTVNAGAGAGIQYAVAGNSAAVSGGTVTVATRSDEPIKVALASASSKVTLKANNWGGTVISAVGQADQPVGVPNVAVAAGSYYWAQVGGECAVLADNTTITRGSSLTISAVTAGAVGVKAGSGTPQVGVASEALVSAEYRAVFLQMD